MDPTSRFLNHVELLHRPGEYDLAVLFFETLGFEHQDLTEVLGASRRLTGIFAGSGERDPLNNVLYLTEFRQPDLQLDDLLRTVAKGNAELQAAIDEHDKLRRGPGDVQHFGLFYPSPEALAAAVHRLEHELPDQLKGRVSVIPQTAVPLPRVGAVAHQGFVYTDLIGTGLFPFGQVIELQAQSDLAA
jgi:hypothetical protein